MSNLQKKGKIFIFLTANVMNTGGGPRYILAKKHFLEKQGWNVLVISVQNDGVILPGLEEYKQWTISAFSWRPSSCSKSVVGNICKRICEQYKNSDRIVIESHQPIGAEWGELIAKKIKAKHIIYLLDETPIMQKNAVSFMKFKHSRREMAGIADKVIPFLFHGVKEIKNEENYVLLAAGTTDNVVEDYEFPLFNSLPQADYNIGSIGRLEKPYVMSMCSEIVVFAKKHPDEKINVILIGGSDEHKIKNIKNKISEGKNINLLITGSLSKIPKSFFDLTDVVVASSGSAMVACQAGALTISLDANDYKPLGILGYTTQEILFRKTPAEFSLSELLEKILIEKYDENLQFTKLSILKESTEDVFQKHMDFIENSGEEMVYFNSLIYEYSFKAIFCRILFAIFGKNDGDFSKPIWIIKKYYVKIKNLVSQQKSGGIICPPST
jgi:hypothetical protein